MRLNQKIEIQEFLKGIIRNLNVSGNSKKIEISSPVFVFETEEKLKFLMEIITDLEIEIKKEEKELEAKKK
jgi:hypothetical protein